MGQGWQAAGCPFAIRHSAAATESLAISARGTTKAKPGPESKMFLGQKSGPTLRAHPLMWAPSAGEQRQNRKQVIGRGRLSSSDGD